MADKVTNDKEDPYSKVDPIFRQVWKSWKEFEKDFQNWCDTNFQPVAIRSSLRIPDSDANAKTFKYS